MLLFCIGFFAGGFLGIFLMTALAAGRREDEWVDRMLDEFPNHS